MSRMSGASRASGHPVRSGRSGRPGHMGRLVCPGSPWSLLELSPESRVCQGHPIESGGCVDVCGRVLSRKRGLAGAEVGFGLRGGKLV